MRRTVLPHGLQVVTEDLPGARSFCVGVFAGVGSRHESPELHGASHFLEHVLFKGTERRTAEEISAAVESRGGELNAYTAKEHTCFYARVLADDADVAVDVLTDMVADALVRDDDVVGERAVILDEIAMHADDPGEVVAELSARTVFAGSGLAASVIGSRGSIEAMSRDQVVGHWRRHYLPERLVVAATGQVDHDRLVAQVAGLDAAADASAGAPAAGRPAPVGGLVVETRRLEQTNAVLAFPGPGLGDDRRYPVGLLSLILGGGMASRLFVEVRERRGLTYAIDAGETCYSDAGVWSVDWQCAPERLGDILDVVHRSLAEVAERGVPEPELRRAQDQLRGQTVLAYESANSRMTRLGANALVGDSRTLAEVVQRYDAVTPEDLQRTAAELFAAPATLALVGPRLPARDRRRLARRYGEPPG